MKVEKALVITFVSIFLLMTLWLKVLGSTTVPIDVEKNGYCKYTYDDDWKNQRGTDFCYDKKDYKTKIGFTEEEFRNTCPKNKILSISFYSDCFHKSGSIS